MNRNYETMYVILRDNSIGSKRTPTNDKRRSKGKKSKRALIHIMAIILTVTLAGKVTQEVTKKYKDYVDTTTAISTMQDKFIDDLNAYGLRNSDPNKANPYDMFEQNTPISYQRLGGDFTTKEVYIAKTVLDHTYTNKSGNLKNEFDNFIRAVSYRDNEGNIKYYTDFNDYLRKNGFESEEEYINTMRNNILNDYRNGNINENYETKIAGGKSI